MTPESLALSFPLVIVALLLGIFGIVLGFHIGNNIGEKTETKRHYWLYNFYVYVAVIAAIAVFIGIDLVMLIAFCLGFLGGAIAGLRMGFGQAVGPWKLQDRFFRPSQKSNDPRDPKSPRNRPKKHRKGEDVPELMSVQWHETGADNSPDARDSKKTIPHKTKDKKSSENTQK